MAVPFSVDHFEIIFLKLLQSSCQLSFRLFHTVNLSQRAVGSAKNEVSPKKVGTEMIHKGAYIEQFLPCDMSFTECAAPVSHHALLTIITQLRQNRSNPSLAAIIIKEKKFVKIRQDEHWCRYQPLLQLMECSITYAGPFARPCSVSR